jgi:hypothetical protein
MVARWGLARMGWCVAIFVGVSLLMLGAPLRARPQAEDVGIQVGQIQTSAEAEVVQGTVINLVTREPIARALVYTPDNRYAVMTDDRGHFEFRYPARDGSNPPNFTPSDDPAETQAQQRAMQHWYARNARFETFFVKKPGYMTLDHEIRSTTATVPATPMIIELEPEARIIGHVQLPDMDGVQRGNVQIYRQDFEQGQPSWKLLESAKIRADGEFRFADLPAGTYKLFTLEEMERVPPVFNPRSQMFGYPPVYFPNSKDFASSTPIHLAAGATFEGNISLVRREYYPVKIGVSGAEGSGVAVTVYPQGHAGPGYELGFDPSEEAVRGLLPEGSYTLKVSTQEQQGSSGTLNFTVRGGPVEGVSVALVPNISLAVNVNTDFESELSSDPQVFGTAGGGGFRSISQGQLAISLTPVDRFENGGGAFGNQPRTNAETRLIVPNIAPGNYWVRIQTPGCYAASASWGGTDLLRHPIVVGTDGAGTPVEVVLRNDGAEVSGSVQEARHGGSPAAKDAAPAANNAEVYFVPTSDSEGQFREIRAMNGQFSLGMIPPGTYRVLAFTREQKEVDFSNKEEMRKFESKGVVLSLAPNQREDLQTPLTLVDEP